MLLAERCESERLRQIIQELQRHRFGRKAETLPEEQMLLGLEDVEQVAAAGEAKQDEDAPEGLRARLRPAWLRRPLRLARHLPGPAASAPRAASPPSGRSDGAAVPG